MPDTDPKDRRIELPSGGWWDLRIRPTVRQMKAIDRIVEDAEGDPDGKDYDILVLLTPEWSFDEEVVADVIEDVRADDLVEVMLVFTDEVMPFLERLQERARRLPSGSSKPSPTSGSQRNTPR